MKHIKNIADLLAFIKDKNLSPLTPIEATGAYGSASNDLDVDLGDEEIVKCPDPACSHQHTTRVLIIHTGICTG